MSDPPLSSTSIAMATIRRPRTRARRTTLPKPHTTTTPQETTQETTPPTPHLLRLPGEIRNQIYNHLVVFPHPIPICASRRTQPLSLIHI